MDMIKGVMHPKMFDRKSKSTIIGEDDKLLAGYLKILILSTTGELLSDPNYGCNLSSLLFDANDAILVDQIKDSIVSAIRTYAPALVVTFDDISITQSETTAYIQIRYRWSNKSSGSTVLNLEILDTEVTGG